LAALDFLVGRDKLDSNGDVGLARHCAPLLDNRILVLANRLIGTSDDFLVVVADESDEVNLSDLIDGVQEDNVALCAVLVLLGVRPEDLRNERAEGSTPAICLCLCDCSGSLAELWHWYFSFVYSGRVLGTHLGPFYI